MKAIITHKMIFLVTLTYFLIGCNKEKIGNAITNSGPCYCNGNSLTSFNVSLKRVNTYPAGSKIFVERFGYPKADSSTIYNYAVFDKSMPFNDTTFSRVEIKNYTQYIKWKILAPNNDSLFGGITPKLTTGDSPILFDINY
jgi:hypothetical protein